MRLRPDELQAWRVRVAQTARPERRAPPVSYDDDTRYERWLWSRAWHDLFALEGYGRPLYHDAEDVIATALESQNGSPAPSDSCCVQKMSGRLCDGSCRRWQR